MAFDLIVELHPQPTDGYNLIDYIKSQTDEDITCSVCKLKPTCQRFENVVCIVSVIAEAIDQWGYTN
jgi:hypothetical protein